MKIVGDYRKLMKVEIEEINTSSLVENPKVTVCVFTYNHESFIEDCVTGILKQKTNFPFLIYLGEDASTDNTRQVCRELAAKYPEQIRLVLHRKENKIQINGKPIGRFNAVHAYSTTSSPYLAICEGDDYWTDENKLQKQVDFLEAHRDVCLTGTAAIVNTDNPEMNGKKVHPERDAQAIWDLRPVDFATDNPIVTCTSVFRRPDIFHMPADYLKTSSGDWFLWLYLMRQYNAGAVYMNVCTSVYRWHDGGAHSKLSDTGKHEFYRYNLNLIRNLLPDQASKVLNDSKAKWYQVQLIRGHLEKRQWVKAVWKMLGLLKFTGGKSDAIELLGEMKNLRKNAAEG